MRHTITYVAIAALATAWCVPAGSAPTSEQLPVEVLCGPDGKVAALRMIVPAAGRITLKIPPDVCDAQPPAPPPHPRAPASSARPAIRL